MLDVLAAMVLAFTMGQTQAAPGVPPTTPAPLGIQCGTTGAALSLEALRAVEQKLGQQLTQFEQQLDQQRGALGMVRALLREAEATAAR